MTQEIDLQCYFRIVMYSRMMNLANPWILKKKGSGNVAQQ
jgi:hypothetical protein